MYIRHAGRSTITTDDVMLCLAVTKVSGVLYLSIPTPYQDLNLPVSGISWRSKLLDLIARSANGHARA